MTSAKYQRTYFKTTNTVLALFPYAITLCQSYYHYYVLRLRKYPKTTILSACKKTTHCTAYFQITMTKPKLMQVNETEKKLHAITSIHTSSSSTAKLYCEYLNIFSTLLQHTTPACCGQYATSMLTDYLLHAGLSFIQLALI